MKTKTTRSGHAVLGLAMCILAAAAIAVWILLDPTPALDGRWLVGLLATLGAIAFGAHLERVQQ